MTAAVSELEDGEEEEEEEEAATAPSGLKKEKKKVYKVFFLYFDPAEIKRTDLLSLSFFFMRFRLLSIEATSDFRER